MLTQARFSSLKGRCLFDVILFVVCYAVSLSSIQQIWLSNEWLRYFCIPCMPLHYIFVVFDVSVQYISFPSVDVCFLCLCIRCWMAVRASTLECRLERYRMKKMKEQLRPLKKNPRNHSCSQHWVCFKCKHRSSILRWSSALIMLIVSVKRWASLISLKAEVTTGKVQTAVWTASYQKMNLLSPNLTTR